MYELVRCVYRKRKKRKQGEGREALTYKAGHDREVVGRIGILSGLHVGDRSRHDVVEEGVGKTREVGDVIAT